MAADTLVIKINGDIKNFQDALENANKKTESLNDSLSAAAKASGIAFAALTATIGLSISKYAEQEQAEIRLATVLKSTGGIAGVTADQVKNLATNLEQLTLFEGDAIIEGQNVLLTYTKIGKETFPRATQAMVDLAQATGQDLTSAAKILGKALDSPADGLGVLAKQGVRFTEAQEQMIKTMAETGRTADAQRIILDALDKKIKGAAEAATQGTGQFKMLEKSFFSIFENIGAKLAPAFIDLASNVKKLFDFIAGNDTLVTMIKNFLVVGTSIAGVVLAISTAGMAFLKFKAILDVVRITTAAMSMSVKVLVGSTGIGLIAIVLAAIVLDWDKSWAYMKGVFNAFVNNIVSLGKGLGDTLVGIFTLNPDKFKSGIAQIQAAFLKGVDEFKAEVAKIPPPVSPLAPDPKATVAKFEEDRALANEQYAIDLEIAKQRKELEKEELAFVRQEELESQQAYQDLKLEQDALNNAKAQKQIEANKKTVLQTQRDLENEKLKKQVDSNNLYLRNQQEYGTAYAEIAKATNSEIFQGTKQAASDLAQLQQSENSKLKAIGKAAAVTDIIMNGILAAQRVFTGLSTIPIIGPALGAVGAAAAIAGSLERANKVRAMARGGVVTGGIPGVDSVPILAQRNEIVAPAQNFNEVIGSVRAAREAEKFSQINQTESQSQPESGGVMEVIVGFKEDFFEVVEKNLLKRRALGIGNL